MKYPSQYKLPVMDLKEFIKNWQEDNSFPYKHLPICEKFEKNKIGLHKQKLILKEGILATDQIDEEALAQSSLQIKKLKIVFVKDNLIPEKIALSESLKNSLEEIEVYSGDISKYSKWCKDSAEIRLLGSLSSL